jgi:signal transduction histidine kinase
LRYRLDGYDTDWSKPVPAGERPYTNLGPNKYRFRLIASNSDGVWDKRETAIDFEVLPAIWQTLWFQFSILALCVLIAVAIYRLRLIQLTKQLNLRFEERLSERTLIAQNLHDTLLQGVLSAAMQLHVALDGVPDELPARRRLDRVLELLQQASDEGRNALQGLRSTESDVDDLEVSLSRLGEDHFVSPHTAFRVIVEGRSRPLNPLIRDEVYRVGREALVNSFRHSRATSIEAEIQYGRTQFRLVIRDNGVGIDSETIRAGREGHWGLVGMRERSDRIGAKLRVLSRQPGGTEVELTVQGQTAFSLQHAGPDRRRWDRLSRIRGKR